MGRCESKRCKPAPVEVGGRCVYSSDCATDYCVDDVCTSGKPGAPCTADWYCDSRVCSDGKCIVNSVGQTCDFARACRGVDVRCVRDTCQLRGEANATCDVDADCRAGMTCIQNTCLTEAMERARRAALEEEERKRVANEDARMLEASGVKPDRKQAERVTLPPGAGQRVRTAQVKGSGGRAFASCRATERMVGGGCSESVASYPSEFSAEDTVGARWNCVGGSSELVAYALCASLP